MKVIAITILTFVQLISLINTQNNLSSSMTCTSTNPTTASDCNTHTTNSGNLCCYLTGLQTYSNEKFCLSIPQSSYVGEKTYSYNNFKTYNINCGVTKNLATVLTTCGPAGALAVGDCRTGSSFTNSCCYFKGTPQVASGCYWLGAKYSGDTTWAGLDLNCNSTFITYSMSLLLVFLIFMF